MDTRIEKIKELLASEDFGREVANAETTEDFQAAFKQNGVELTLEEVDSILVQAAAACGMELNEDQLENVSGGFGILGTALILAGGVLVCYGVGWVAGRVISRKSGVCS